MHTHTHNSSPSQLFPSGETLIFPFKRCRIWMWDAFLSIHHFYYSSGQTGPLWPPIVGEDGWSDLQRKRRRHFIHISAAWLQSHHLRDGTIPGVTEVWKLHSLASRNHSLFCCSERRTNDTVGVTWVDYYVFVCALVFSGYLLRVGHSNPGEPNLCMLL